MPHLLPNGLDAAGTGLILLGLNAARSLRRVPINRLLEHLRHPLPHLAWARPVGFGLSTAVQAASFCDTDDRFGHDPVRGRASAGWKNGG
jgi:hypothetical protein